MKLRKGLVMFIIMFLLCITGVNAVEVRLIEDEDITIDDIGDELLDDTGDEDVGEDDELSDDEDLSFIEGDVEVGDDTENPQTADIPIIVIASLGIIFLVVALKKVKTMYN